MRVHAQKAVGPDGAAHTPAAPAHAYGMPVSSSPQVLQRLLRSRVIQAKLTVSQPGDPLEEEADRVAETVMRMPAGAPSLSAADPGIQRKRSCSAGGHICDKCSKEEEKKIQTKEAPGRTPSLTPQAEAHVESLRGGGQPLPSSVRSFFEPRFGRDFSGVRIHSDTRANQAASAVQARAFTLGKDVVFGSGEYAPQSPEGQKLLAHELAHTVQQSKAPAVCSRLLQRRELDDSQSDIWGGFKITPEGTSTRHVPIVRADLNALNATDQGKKVLGKLSEKFDHWYSGRIRINPTGGCGYDPRTRQDIGYNYNRCPFKVKCPDDATEKAKWKDVPNYVWLFHEIVHAYLDHVAGVSPQHPDFECMTVGLGDYFHKIPYNENRLRCELRLPVRPCYTEGWCLGMEPPVCPG